MAGASLTDRGWLPVRLGRSGLVGVGRGAGRVAIEKQSRRAGRGCLSLACVDVAESSGTQKDEAFAGLRRHESNVDRSLREFVAAEEVFDGGVFVDQAQRAAAGVSGLVKCRHMSRHIRALDGGRARLEALQGRCAEAVSLTLNEIEPSQMAVACNSLTLSTDPCVVAMYAGIAEALMSREARELRPKDLILLLNSMARAAGGAGGAGGAIGEGPLVAAAASSSPSPSLALSTGSQWSKEVPRALALHLCRGLLSQRESGGKEAGSLRGDGARGTEGMDGEWGLGLNAIDVSSMMHALGKIFPMALEGERCKGGSAEDRIVEECADYGMDALLALSPPALGPQAIANVLNGISRLGLAASAKGSNSPPSSSLPSSSPPGGSPATRVDQVLAHLDMSIDAVGAAGGKGRGGGWMVSH